MWEKLVALAAKRFVVIVDESKMADKLVCSAPPVEVIPFGWRMAQKHLGALGGKPVCVPVYRAAVQDGLRELSAGLPLRRHRQPSGPALQSRAVAGRGRHLGFIGITSVVMVGHSDGTVERISGKADDALAR